MKKKLKALLAGLLTAAVAVGMVPMTAMAADATTETADQTVEEVVLDAAAALPSKWDNSTNENAKYLPPVKSQGAFGSCAFWSTVYYQFTYMMNKARGVATTEDNTYSPNFIYNLTNGGNYGSPSTPLTPYQLLVVQGTPTIKDVPLTGSTTPATNYTSWHAEEGIWEHAMQNRLKDYVVYAYGSVQHPIYDFDAMTVIPANATISDPKDENLDAIKTAISNGEVLTFSSAILGWRYTNLKTPGAADNPNGYTIDTRFSGEQAVYAAGSNILIADYLVSATGHEMTIVGYNDEIWVDINDNNTVDKGEMGAFKIVNSWGDDWGNDGFMWIAYDAINQTSSVSNAPTVEKRAPAIHGVGGMVVSGKQDDSSDVYLSYTLNAPRRTEVRLTVIAKDQSGKTVKEFKVTPYETLNFYEHKNFSYNGHEGRCEDGIMAFDLNNVVADITSETLDNYDWSVKVEDQDEDLYTLNIKDIKIVDKKSGKTYPMDSAAFSLNGSTKTVSIPVGGVTPDPTPDPDPTPENQVTIYYKGYSTPYIHYRAGAGTWTAVPGVAMTKTSEVSGYTHKYTIDLGKETYAEVCFNDGNNNWDSQNGANYKFNTGTYTFSNGTIKTYTPPQPTVLTVSDVKLSSSYVPTNQNFTATATATGGTAPYQYRFTTSYRGNEVVLQDYSTSATCTTKIGQYAAYTLIVTVKDATGATATKSTNLTVTYATISKLNADKDTVKTGEKVRFSVEAQTNNIPVTYKYTVKSGSTTVATLSTNSDNTAAWVPKTEGTYSIVAELLYNGTVISSLTRDYTVEKGAEVTTNQTTIYYKGYSTPYIHYRAGTGAWTAVPGVAMTKTSEVTGYTHKYTIDLGTASYAEVCFNDGNNNWDSRNGANYQFNAGTYTFSNGTIKTYTPPQPTALSLSVALSDTAVPSGKNFTIKATATGGTAPYQYRYTAVYRGNETVLKDYSTSASCTASLGQYAVYTIKVTVKDAAGTTVEKTTDLTVTYVSSTVLMADKTTAKTGEKVTFTTQAVTNGIPVTYKYTVTGNGTTTTLTSTGTTATWTPSKTGTYTARVDLLYQGESIAYHTTTCTVEKGADVTANQITIYYKGYATPYIHYCVGTGAWTAVPGKAMTKTGEVSGYTHKYTIDLGTATYAQVCFNDGNNNWDSRNGANYRFEKGTYAYANGNMTKIGGVLDGSESTIDPSLQNLSTVSDEIITLGETLTVNAYAIGGEGDYTYTVSYKKKSSDKWTAAQYFKANDTVTIKPGAAVEYDICVKVKDGTNTIVKKYFTVKAVKKLTNTATISSVSIKKGSTVTLNCSAKGGKGGYTYTVSYKKKSSDKWTAAQYFKANDTVTIKPAAAVAYDICVKAKDSEGTITKQYFTVTVK